MCRPLLGVLLLESLCPATLGTSLLTTRVETMQHMAPIHGDERAGGVKRVIGVIVRVQVRENTRHLVLVLAYLVPQLTQRRVKAHKPPNALGALGVGLHGRDDARRVLIRERVRVHGGGHIDRALLALQHLGGLALWAHDPRQAIQAREVRAGRVPRLALGLGQLVEHASVQRGPIAPLGVA